eukprot:12611417-Alexandrium_andersonii.AAC.1
MGSRPRRSRWGWAVATSHPSPRGARGTPAPSPPRRVSARARHAWRGSRWPRRSGPRAGV